MAEESKTTTTEDLGDFTVPGVCNELKCGKSTVYKMLNKGELKGYKVGSGIRIRRSSVNSLKDNNPYVPQHGG